MARGTHTRKRSGGPIRRKAFKKRRVSRRRSTATTGSNSGPTSVLFRRRGRKMKMGSYRAALLRSSMFAAHYSYTESSNATMATPATLTTMTYASFLALSDIGTSTKWSNPNGTTVPSVIPAGFTVRGGLSKVTIACEATEEIEYKVYLLWVKPGGTVPSSGTFDKMFNPVFSATDATDSTVRIVKCWAGNLIMNGCQSFYTKIKAKKYDQTFYALGTDALYWYVGVGNTVTGAASNVSLTLGVNASVCVNSNA